MREATGMMEKTGVIYQGFPSKDELKNSGVPSENRIKRPVACIECVEIPCNPCEEACPYGAISVGTHHKFAQT